ncbi:retroviral-like aspartic protease family protein [Pseudomonas hormoni]|uniref:Retroviral-like aspartic protease family protein n=1 Tax=Pseudomonas hormoni TaxID=3093767 RepID=A0ABX8EUW3_9PSED|nr:retropepsin-like aspartic protease [Pseudomonas hormoni]QVW22926.1 retroviral-like aspartic protease family protein [Pseudomonas hormoni]
MNAVSRRETCLICALTVFLVVSKNSTADNAAPDFYTWIESGQGRSASLAQMKQRCDDVRDAEKNLQCSVSVLARMFEAKAANQLPDYYLAIKRRHAGAIANDPELKLMFSMFGSESIATLRTVADFSVTRTKHHEVLPIHPYPGDGHVTDEALPYIDVKAANGVSARFILDTGAPQTRVNTETAKLMGIRLLTDSHYGYSTFYGERDLAAQLGILESLKIGTSEFRNVLVFVSDRDNLLGLDLIGKSGRLKVTNKTLEINAAPPTRCDSPITYVRMDINQRLTIAARLDRRATLAIVDTGNVDYLTSSSPGHSPDNVTVTPSHRTYRGELSLSGRIRSITYKYYPDYTIPPSLLLGQYVPSILLGWGAFNDYELNLDIASGLSCFNRV